jgi:hypothetical protein
MSIKLNISIGEAIDKLTILDIKKCKIDDERKINVEKEFKYLYDKLHNLILKYDYHYNVLKKTNLEIWEKQDVLRNKKSKNINFYKICEEILNLNDSRFLIKKKINNLTNSIFKEEKGYEIRGLNLFFSCDLDTIKILNGAVRYYSFNYDILNLYVSENIYNSVKDMFVDDYTIIINIEHTDFNINYDKINIEVDDKIKIETIQTHSLFINKEKIKNNDYNLSLKINKIYQKLNLDISIFHNYNYNYEV